MQTQTEMFKNVNVLRHVGMMVNKVLSHRKGRENGRLKCRFQKAFHVFSSVP